MSLTHENQLLWRLESDAEHISLLEVLIHLEAYDDLEEVLILTVVVDDFLSSE